MTDILDFYKQHGISPVRQDISDLDAHIARRNRLYRQLGILPAFLSGRHVLEVGPGSGHNAVHTLSLHPSLYVLVEGNPTGASDLRARFAGTSRLVIVEQRIEHWDSHERFDFVFCEGLLGLAGVNDPSELLRSIARFVAPDGVLVITCIDPISYLSEALRRVLAHLLINEQRADLPVLAQAFGPHLATLHGMTRSVEDWIVDNLISPASSGSFFTIPHALSTLSPAFDFYASSPHFVTDWSWYKGPKIAVNSRAENAYWLAARTLLDYRSDPIESANNRELMSFCLGVRHAAVDYERTKHRHVLKRLLQSIDLLQSAVIEDQFEVYEALEEFSDWIRNPAVRVHDIATSRHFGPWFGRGQQYVSFSRRATGS